MNDGEQAVRERDEQREWKMETLIGYVLLIGVLLSVLLILSGVIWHWVATGRLQSDYTIPRENLFEFVASVVGGIGAGFTPRLLMSLGIAVLMLVPYTRVLASVLFFALIERNWKYVVFTGVVLTVLSYSLFLR